jgi:hypothetical protein
MRQPLESAFDSVMRSFVMADIKSIANPGRDFERIGAENGGVW